MDFQYKNNQLIAENLPVKQLAEQFGTPLYVPETTLERHWHAFNNAFGETSRIGVLCRKINPKYCDFKRDGKIRIRL